MKEIIAEQSESYQEELAALARLVTFARQSAQDLNVSFPAYCLDMALSAILDELKVAGVDVSSLGKREFSFIQGYH